MGVIARLVGGCALLVLAGCASMPKENEPTPAEVGDEQVKLKGCMNEVRTGRTYDGPVLASVSRRLATALFFCQYFEGEEVEVLGRKISLPSGRHLVAGYGYALADQDPRLTSERIENELRRVSGVRHRNITVDIYSRSVKVFGYGKMSVFRIRVGHRYFGPSPVVGALLVRDVTINQMPYTLFMWVQGAHLTNKTISDRLKEVLPFVLAPQQVAEE